MQTAKTLIRLGGYPGWSESSLGANSFCWFCHVMAQMTRKLVIHVHATKLFHKTTFNRLCKIQFLDFASVTSLLLCCFRTCNYPKLSTTQSIHPAGMVLPLSSAACNVIRRIKDHIYMYMWSLICVFCSKQKAIFFCSGAWSALTFCMHFF